MGKGKLVFKGDTKSKKKKRKSKHVDVSSGGSIVATSIAATSRSSVSGQIIPTLPNPPPQGQTSASDVVAAPVIKKGKGKITSSGCVLMGYETDFKSSLNVGDAIIANVSTEDESGQIIMEEEMRVVTMRLSDTSASVSTPFSQDLKHPTAFKCIAKPKNAQQERLERQKKDKLTKDEIERSAFGTYKSGAGNDGKGKEFVYRERTETGNYRIRREVVAGNTERSTLLDMRTQKKSDKYC